VSKVLVVVLVGWETYNQFARGRSTTNPTTPSSVRRKASTTSDKEENKEDEEQAERWARQVREEMLKESLLNKGRTTGNGTEKVETVETDIHEID